MKKMFIIYLFCFSMLFSDTLDIAKNLSYLASVEYINRNFEESSVLYKKSLNIRKSLNLKNEGYVTVLKMYIYSLWKINSYCGFEISEEDFLLLKKENDKDFFYDLRFMNNFCNVMYN